jgi:hypothetical protein
MGNNMFHSFDEIKQLASLERLSALDLIGNPITENPNYQLTIFELLSNL